MFHMETILPVFVGRKRMPLFVARLLVSLEWRVDPRRREVHLGEGIIWLTGRQMGLHKVDVYGFQLMTLT